MTLTFPCWLKAVLKVNVYWRGSTKRTCLASTTAEHTMCEVLVEKVDPCVNLCSGCAQPEFRQSLRSQKSHLRSKSDSKTECAKVNAISKTPFWYSWCVAWWCESICHSFGTHGWGSRQSNCGGQYGMLRELYRTLVSMSRHGCVMVLHTTSSARVNGQLVPGKHLLHGEQIQPGQIQPLWRSPSLQDNRKQPGEFTWTLKLKEPNEEW